MTKIELIHGDCMIDLVNMKDNEYSLSIVDPPYGIGDVWSKSRRDRFHKEGKLHKYQNQKPPDKSYFDQMQRISKNQIIWGWNYFCHKLPETNNIIIWDKKRDFEKTFMSEAELAWTSFSNPVRIFAHQWDGAKKGPENGKCVKIHPHQKPIGLYKWSLKKFAKPGDKIIDTHGGSMSIVIACIDMGFDIKVYEDDKYYFDAAVKRVWNHINQLNAFIERPEIICNGIPIDEYIKLQIA